MCNQKEAANTILVVLEEDFHFSEKERVEALLLALEMLGNEKLLEEKEENCEVN